jgi:hypothetical protein
MSWSRRDIEFSVLDDLLNRLRILLANYHIT